jgi:hypothetical protein
MPLVGWFGKWTATQPKGIFLPRNVTFITPDACFIQQSAGFITGDLTLSDNRGNIARMPVPVAK